MTPAESIALGRRLEPFHPYFYEDSMLPDSSARMADVQQQCNIPIATGERFTSIFEHRQLLEAKATAYVRPDVCLCGGLTGCKKVAAMAEAQHVKVIPHNPLSPVSTAACIQLDAAIPNFALQEYTGEAHPPKPTSEGCVSFPTRSDGWFRLFFSVLWYYGRQIKASCPLRQDVFQVGVKEASHWRVRGQFMHDLCASAMRLDRPAPNLKYTC
jgi:L-alanine-DL-glutamate epimerase-like enolase superfamily enzyme